MPGMIQDAEVIAVKIQCFWSLGVYIIVETDIA